MTTKTIIISLIIVVAICVVVFEYFHKKHAKYTEDELKQFTIDLLRKRKWRASPMINTSRP